MRRSIDLRGTRARRPADIAILPSVGAQHGITLIELLVALAIVALLSALVFPTYNRYQLRTFRTQAYTDLATCALNAEAQRGNAFTYVGIAAGTVPVAAVCSQFSPSDATGVADAKYQISVPAVSATTFTLRATPLNGQVDDGAVEIDATGARRWDNNGDGDFGDAGENSWDE